MNNNNMKSKEKMYINKKINKKKMNLKATNIVNRSKTNNIYNFNGRI